MTVQSVIRLASIARRWGDGVAAGYVVAALRDPDRDAVIDDTGALTFGQLDVRTNALADGLTGHGVGEGDLVALMCRNHRGFVEAMVALAKLGADVLFVNAELSAPVVAGALVRHRATALIQDADMPVLPTDKRFLALTPGDGIVGGRTLEGLIARGDPSPRNPPRRPGRHVILTSGTTGVPKGALRRQSWQIRDAVGLYSAIPLRPGEATVIAAPLFHSWGLGGLLLSLPLASTIVLRRRFDPNGTIKAVESSGATALWLVPLMLRRILALPPETFEAIGSGLLRAIVCSGSALDGRLAAKATNVFGDVLYNLYGTTEVAWATIAAPADLRAAPGTVGYPPRGTTVKVLGTDDREVRHGQTGRIFVAGRQVFDGYSDNTGKEMLDDMIPTGDIGHFDEAGRLFVDGRNDDMIVSGGENVHPQEVEGLFASHPEIEDAAVLGVPDVEFGQRLRAFIVPRTGSKLTVEDVKDFVKTDLARYKVPRDVIFLNELPRNSTGKVMKRELANYGRAQIQL